MLTKDAVISLVNMRLAQVNPSQRIATDERDAPVIHSSDRSWTPLVRSCSSSSVALKRNFTLRSISPSQDASDHEALCSLDPDLGHHRVVYRSYAPWRVPMRYWSGYCYREFNAIAVGPAIDRNTGEAYATGL